MNKIYLSLLFILLLSCADKDDAVKSYWDNGNLKSELRYEEGKLNGLCRWYYNNGKPEMEVIYDMNVLEGPGKRWHENGNIESVFYYKNNVFDSIVEWYNVSGLLVKRENYVDGVLNGLFNQWYDSGKIFIEGEYLDGMMHGSWLMYYEDGSIGSNSVFDRGTGVQRGYADGGSYLRSVIYYKDNLKHGREIHYNIKGEVEEILLWENGEYVGNDNNIYDLGNIK